MKGAAAYSAAAAEAIDTERASQAAKEASVVLAEICKLIFSCLARSMSSDTEKEYKGHGKDITGSFEYLLHILYSM